MKKGGQPMNGLRHYHYLLLLTAGKFSTTRLTQTSNSTQMLTSYLVGDGK